MKWLTFQIAMHHPFTGSGASTIWLTGGSTGTESMSGTVQVLHNGQWGTVCDEGHVNNNLDAIVICRQLGFLQGVGYTEAHYGRGVGPIWMDNLGCKGTEYRLEDCPHDGWGTHNCNHGEDYGVSCTGEL